jgi:uncharacterized Fe-S cluster protein YjdI
MEMKKEYSTDELTVVWQPRLCQHAAICVSSLPQVFSPREQPWIKPENASAAEIMAVIDRCPSGALSYRLKSKE